MASLLTPSLQTYALSARSSGVRQSTPLLRCHVRASSTAVHQRIARHHATAATASRAAKYIVRSINNDTATVLDNVDSITPGLVDEVHPVVRAHQNGRLGFGFSAGGLLFPYFVGIIAELDALGLITPDTPMAGASAGSLIVASYKSGVAMDEVFQACLEMCKDLRSGGTRFRLGPVLKGVLQGLLPEDIHERCSGSSYIAVTTLFPKTESLLVNTFEDKNDLIETLLTSCHIPFYFNGAPIRMHRRSVAFDGGITNFLPNPMGVDVSVRVSCFPKATMRFLRSISISPDAFEEWPYSIKDMLAWALEPGSEEVLKWLHEKGRRDAREWVKVVKLPATLPLEEGLLVTPPELVIAAAALKQGGTP